jgi:hypothetical protein
MHKLTAAAAALFILTVGASAHAEGVNNLLAGINGLAVFAWDPPRLAYEPPEDFDEMWGAPVTSHVVGFFAGTVMMGYRATMGVLDVALFPFWIFPTLSPDSELQIFPSYEIEYE